MFSALRLCLSVLCLAIVFGVQPSFAATPVAAAAQVEEGAGTVRISFDLNALVAAEAYVMAGPDRVIVDLPEVNFQLPPRTGQAEARGRSRNQTPAKIVASFRFGLFAPGKSRIVIDLGRPALVAGVSSMPRPEGGFRLQIDLKETDAAAFALASRAAANEAVARDILSDAPRPAARSAEALRPMIVIDPGHGGIDVGAQGAQNVIEKDIVFEFSRVLRAQMEASGRYRVAMTRDSDVFVPLAQRVKIARDFSADLFISIHADTLSDTGGVSGATIYTRSDRASDRQAARLAEKENLADAAGGLEAGEDTGDVSDILFDLTRRETRAYSHVFARTLVNYWSEAARLNKNPIRSAGFRVLNAPDVPSVLLELGYLSNEKDTAALLKPEWRLKTADAMVRAIDTFFAPRVSGGSAQSGSGGGQAR
jgi:N-acetylmuramoyl-L-alanine amidase